MMGSTTKPKLLFFQYRYDLNLPEFLLIHKREHVKCLSEFFDVTVIHADCDYEEMCDKHEPDLALFESGVNHVTCQRLKIANIRANPKIPKLGLHNADAFCNARAGFLSDMDHWGIDTFFAISTTAAEHTPEIAENLLVWPNCIDGELYRDYGLWKSIPVLFTGSKTEIYPWRKQILNTVSKQYPSLICPHPGYDPNASGVQAMYGERYARTINASSLVPTCGTVAKEVVRKHFEIPACRSCLVTEKSPALEAAGFVDMKNCVFVNDRDALDKIGYLFHNPNELERITDAGYQLVHARHTAKQRGQIFQWYQLHKHLLAGQRIVQTNPFEPLTVVDKASGVTTSHISGAGLHLKLLREGDQLLGSGKYAAAEECYLRCLNYMPWMPEPKLRMALCRLYQGDAKAARLWIAKQIEFILFQYKAIDPDPVEWTYHVISLLGLGKLKEAADCAAQYRGLRHPELDRARWMIKALRTEGEIPSLDLDDPTKRRRTIHQLPDRGLKEWLAASCLMLKACGQRDMAEKLARLRLAEVTFSKAGESTLRTSNSLSEPPQAQSNQRRSQEAPANNPRKNALGFYLRLLLNSKLRPILKWLVERIVHPMEAKFGCFLPYKMSEIRKDECFREIRQLTREEPIQTALVIGAARGQGSTESFLTGILENHNRPTVFCIGNPTRRFTRLAKAYENFPAVKCHAISSTSAAGLHQELERAILKIKQDNQSRPLDAVLIDVSNLKDPMPMTAGLTRELLQARLVLLHGLISPPNFDIYHQLLHDPIYEVVAHNPGLRDGYAIFRRVDSVASLRDEGRATRTSEGGVFGPGPGMQNTGKGL